MSNQGWECPKCGTCYAPFVVKCETCRSKTEREPSTFERELKKALEERARKQQEEEAKKPPPNPSRSGPVDRRVGVRDEQTSDRRVNRYGYNSPQFCDHANECPAICPCSKDCYCWSPEGGCGKGYQTVSNVPDRGYCE